MLFIDHQKNCLKFRMRLKQLALKILLHENVKCDMINKLSTYYSVSDAALNGSECSRAFFDNAAKVIYADNAYLSKFIAENLSGNCENQIC